MTLTMTL